MVFIRPDELVMVLFSFLDMDFQRDFMTVSENEFKYLEKVRLVFAC